MVDIGRSSVDLAIRYGCGDWPDFVVEPLVVTQNIIAAALAYWRTAAVRQPEDLLDLPWQRWRARSLTEWLLARGVKVGERPNITYLPGILMRDALLEGQGIGIVAQAQFREHLESGRLVQLMIDETTANCGFHIVHPKGPIRPPVAAFISWLKKEAAASGE